MSTSKAPAAPRFRLIRFDAVKLDGNPQYLVQKLVPRDGITVVWGPPKCGKSLWVQDISMHVALGWEYRGRRVGRGPVVYIACEGERGLRARIEAWRRERLETYEYIVPFWLLPTQLNLIDEWSELVASIRKAIGEVPPAAIVIDTLNRSLVGSESSDEDMGAYIRAADSVRGCFPGCALIVVHHCGHDATRLRGHTALAGALDCEISVKRSADGLITTEVERMKDGPEGERTASRLQVVDVGVDSDGEPITSCVVQPADGEAVMAQAPSGQAQIALDLLKKAVVQAGESPPANNHIPGTKKVVPLTLWRGFCKSGGLAAGDNEEAFKKAFQRARVKLQNAGFISIWDDKVWLVNTEGDTGT